MSRTFSYARVSTLEQNTDNQIKQITDAGFAIQEHRIVVETISGSVPILNRPEFVRLMDKMERDDVLVVTKLDRLGRDAIDVSITVGKLEKSGIKVHCLALGGVDLTSPAGKMTMHIINAVAQFERELLIERTQAGLAVARSKGIRLGRSPSLTKEQEENVIERIENGETISAIAKFHKTSRQTVNRTKDKFNPTKL
jgi:putative DNA-invertase from lambdoid prophage Rac